MEMPEIIKYDKSIMASLSGGALERLFARKTGELRVISKKVFNGTICSVRIQCKVFVKLGAKLKSSTNFDVEKYMKNNGRLGKIQNKMFAESSVRWDKKKLLVKCETSISIEMK